MDKNISKRDWEMISAYLDAQLSGRKLSRFESRLSQEPDLRTALNDLHQTRQVLRNSPSLSVPRNFLLTPQMVGRIHHFPHLAPAFGWISAVASMFLVILLVGDFFSSAGVIPVSWNNVPRLTAPLSQEISNDNAAMQTYAEPSVFDATGAGGSSGIDEAGSALEEELQGMIVLPEMESEAVGAAAQAEVDASSATAQVTPDEQPASDVEEDVNAVAEAPVESELLSPKMLTDTTRLGEGEGFMSVAFVPSQTITTEVTIQEEDFPRVELTATETVPAEILQGENTPTLPVVETATEEVVSPMEETPRSVEQPATSLPEPMAEMAVKAAPETGAETFIAEEQIQNQTPASAETSGDLIVGLEVGFVLLALGSALAWIYLRYRGS
jgi:hypothetical protein